MVKKIRKKLPPLHPAQRLVAESPARFKILIAGRRFGKSILGSRKCLKKAAHEGGRTWWVWPSFPLGAVGFRMLKEATKGIPGVDPKEAVRRIIFPPPAKGMWAGEVQVKSADNVASLYAEGLDAVVLDEAASIASEDAWALALRPSLMDKKGSGLIITTPKGMNWVARLVEKASDGVARSSPALDVIAEHLIQFDYDYSWGEYGHGELGPDWQVWQFPTFANPYIDPREIEEACRDMPALVFAQEILAQFTSQFGAMFKREWFHIIPEAPKDLPWVRYWDLAASPEGDPSVGLKGALDGDDLILADMVRGQWNWPALRKKIVSTACRDGKGVVVGIEEAAMQLVAVQDLKSLDELVEYRVKGVPLQSPAASVRALYDSLPRDKAPKAARAAAWLARAEKGRVYLVDGPWVKGYLDRVCNFPLSGVPDDDVDATSGVVTMLQKSAVGFAQIAQSPDVVSKWFVGEVTEPRWIRGWPASRGR